MKKLLAIKWINNLLKYSFIINVVLYILSCLTPFIHPKYFSPLSFLAIGFPLLLATMLCWLLLSLFIDIKKAIYLLLIIQLGFINIKHTIGFNFTKKKTTNGVVTIKLLSWNVRDFTDNYSSLRKKPAREKYFDFIKQTNADIVCLQDVDNRFNKNYKGAFDFLKDSLGYPFYYFSKDVDTIIINDTVQYGTCIFSKFEIKTANHIKYSGKYFSESLAFADVELSNKKMVRIYNTHLRSMYIKLPKEQRLSDFSYVIEDTNLVMHSNIFTKIKHYDTAHISQAQLIKKVLDTTKIPFIFCADMNSVPSSYTYHILSKNLNDVFLQTQLGWLGTYFSTLPFLRIDAVLMSKNLSATTYSSPRFKLSDHYPIITEIKLP